MLGSKLITIVTGYILIWTLIGYGGVAAVTNMIGLPTTNASIFFRGATALLSLLLVVAGLLAGKVNGVRKDVALFLLFWVIYLFKIYYTLVLNGEPASRPVEEFFIWGIGVCMLPALALFFGPTAESFRKILPHLIWLLALTTIIFILQGGSQVLYGIFLVDMGRWHTESFNPISMGHFGVTTTLIGFASLFAGQARDRTKLLSLFAIVVGLILAVLANSRGPIVAFLICAALFVLRGKRTKLRIGLAIGAVALAPVAFFNLEAIVGLISEPLSRFASISSDRDLSALARFQFYSGAISQFLSGPVFGNGIEERVSLYYPHNVVLEAFMATGVVGGIPFLILLFRALANSWKLIGGNWQETAAGLVATQYIIGAQFSGALYLSGALWASMALALVGRNMMYSKDASQGVRRPRRAFA